MNSTHRAKIFFIGVGNMGNPMALNLLRAGHPMQVFDLDPAKASNLVAQGAVFADSLAQGAAWADVVMASLPGPPQVRGVMLGESGVLAHMQEHTTVIDTSTSAVDLVKELSTVSRKRSIHYLEAPVTNAVDFAALGRLSIFVGGEESSFEQHKGIFEVIGEKIFYVGQHGNAATVKLLTNLLWFVSAATIGEALMLGGRAGVPLHTVWEAIKSSAGNSWVAEHDVPSIFAGHYDPSFSLDLCVKDLTLVNEIAHSQGYSLTMGGVAKSLFEQARATYGGHMGELHVAKLLEDRVGMLLRPPHGQVIDPKFPDSSFNSSTASEHAPTTKEASTLHSISGSSNSWLDAAARPISNERPIQGELLNQSKALMPQGVAENYRYWGEDQTVFVDRAKGCFITDADGKTFVDFRLGYGPIILGYRDPRVDRAVIEQICQRGTLTGFSTALDARVVQQIKDLCPNIEQMRFANSGTEAVMGAVRTARGYTKRERVAIVEGGFHGLYDEMMWKSDVENWDPHSGAHPTVIPFGAGIPAKTRDLVDVIGLNSDEALEELFRTKGEQLACVVLEPIVGNCGSISASPQWLTKLRKLCTQYSTMLIIDEVKTGFRVAKGGAQSLYGIHADLTTYAKALGNGYPVAAFGGRADVMSCVGATKGMVVHGGTYTANMVALSAAHETLNILAQTDALQTVNRVGEQVKQLLSRVFTSAGIEHTFAGPPAMLGIHFTQNVPNNYRDWRLTNSTLYQKFAWKLIEHGVMLEPDSREPWFFCEAHQDLDLGWLEETAHKAMRAAL